MPRKVKIVPEPAAPPELLLPPFDSVPDCPKCRFDQRMWKYCGPQNSYVRCRSVVQEMGPGGLMGMMLMVAPTDSADTLAAPPKFEREHIHKYCPCGFEWLEETSDHLAPWQDRPAWLERSDIAMEG